MTLPHLDARIITEPGEIARLWRSLPETHVCSPAQTVDWFSLWQSNVNQDCLVACLYAGELPIFVLPLEINRSGPCRIAAYPGGPHANCNFPVLSPAHPIRHDDLTRLLDALHRARPDVDVVTLERQLPVLDGYTNPLLQLASRENANVSLGITLDRNFQTVLERHNPKRKKKKHRNSISKLEEAGGYRVVTAATSKETDAMLDSYLANKAEKFAKAGIRNTFAPREIQLFFRQLFARHAETANPLFQLKALEVGGQYRAVLGKSRAKSLTFIDFIGIAEDELSNASPGEFLFFEDIKDSCETNLSIYSFGVGDEPYKRSWCDLETMTYDTQISLTAKGKVYSGYLDMRGHLVRHIKKNDRLWTAVKKLRTRLLGRT
ncbi:GNAT family N-acetyltransferase [Phyllobacterium myrsinacearum]|uniref:CelD/BcsL family acetyltransferase involved in cellulose biosynthesis n=1 Tax=Phyllobacterium myrsinacearum TaxID=28101 RepID=A0A839ECD0_9HYPH|nr:GNAT family N-acetyltransferase [Phyllobacterium myrsinacearum]MBA8876359.1 CelD/BcsL family acetyltransferase involved in cellulose biosynthesis [Phyllobacterium myrsinacearum]